MSFFEFPHTRTYDSDLGWLIKKYPEIAKYAEEAAASKEAAANSAEAAANSADAAANSAEAAANSADAAANSYDSMVQEVSNTTTLLNARLSEAIEGLDPTDSELADIRISNSGMKYSAAGDAVRSQFLQNRLYANTANVRTLTWNYNSTVASDGSIQTGNNAVSDIFKPWANAFDFILPAITGAEYRIAIYRHDGAFIRVTGWNSSSSLNWRMDNDPNYYGLLRIELRYANGNAAGAGLTNTFSLIGSNSDYPIFRGYVGNNSLTSCTDNGYYIINRQDTISDNPISNEIAVLFVMRYAGYIAQYVVTQHNAVYYRTFKTSADAQPFRKLTADVPLYIGYGTINTDTGADVPLQKNRAKTPWYPADYQNAISIPTGTMANIVYADSNYNIVSQSGFLNPQEYSANTPTGATQFRVVFKNTDDTNINDLSIFKDAKINGRADYKNVIYIGDSIFGGYYSVSGGGVPVTPFSIPYWIGQIAKHNVFNASGGGLGFVHTSSDLGVNAVQLVQNIDFSEYDACVIALGLNDWKYNEASSQIESNARAVLNKIITDNPNCSIVIVTPSNSGDYGFTAGDVSTNWGIGYAFSNSGTLENIYEILKRTSVYYGTFFIDNLHESVINRYSIRSAVPDGVHPSIDTEKQIAEATAKAMRI